MKHIKTFEDLNNDIEIGYWVALNKKTNLITSYEYLLYVPWKIIDIFFDGDVIEIRSDEFSTFITDIRNVDFASNNKEDVEAFIQAKKYNL